MTVNETEGRSRARAFQRNAEVCAPTSCGTTVGVRLASREARTQLMAKTLAGCQYPLDASPCAVAS
jgi:hypothetical protein